MIPRDRETSLDMTRIALRAFVDRTPNRYNTGLKLWKFLQKMKNYGLAIVFSKDCH